ncbi:hypothetical protein BRD02_08520 [Halobacteriales archaeon QS_8_69_73]|nr:MAG: hypothetical protein BRD02_08520 [Halobacteriales archaeon QS_8_69_73]
MLLALLVVCSFGGIPTVAAAGGGSSVGDDMSGVLGSDGGSDGGSTGDSAGSDGSDSGSDSDSGSGSGSDSDSAEGSDSGSDGGEDVEAVEDTAMAVEANAVEATGALNLTLGTTDGTVQETTYEALAAVDGTAPMAGQSFDGTTLEFDDRSEQLWARQTAARQTTRDDSYDAGYDMGTDTTAMLGAAEATRATRATRAAGGQDGQSLPDGAGGGTALGLGALAAAVVIRSTPLVAGGGAGASAGTSAASGYLSTLLDRLKPFVFPLRYSRYDDSDPLEHDAREQVYGIVSETPGSYLSKVSERADLPLSTTRHHMKVLEREGLVSGAKLRGKRRFYPAYAEGIELAAALNDESTASIIDALARLGAASVSDLATDLGRDPSTISHHLQRLEEDDIIAREREGRAVMNKLSPEARTALDPEQTPKPEETAEAVAD